MPACWPSRKSFFTEPVKVLVPAVRVYVLKQSQIIDVEDTYGRLVPFTMLPPRPSYIIQYMVRTVEFP